MTARVRFTLEAPTPDDHLLHVRMELDGVGDRDHIDLSMPVWIPGSYFLREFPQHVQNIRAADSSGELRAVRQQDKATWRVQCSGADTLVVSYELFAHELAVRYNHVDDSHVFTNGVATFFYHPDLLNEPIEVTLKGLPDGWQVFTGLDPVVDAEDPHTFYAPNYDVLFDTPIEANGCDPIHFDAAGVPHTIIVWGQESNHDPELLADDVRKCVEANAEMFGGSLPYDHYTFIVHISDKGRGGLEHLNSTVLLWSPEFRHGQAGTEWQDGQIEDDRYLGFMRLVAHEHFHVWNVKRIRPAVLGPFDYQQENYTRDLWTVEGVTSYFEVVGVRRAGMIDGRRFLDIYAKNAMRLSRIPGRLLHSLEDASLNAWVKLYRPNEHTLNSSVSYYLKGEVVCFLLDAHLRVQTGGERSLDDALRLLWSHFEETGEGYPEGSYGDWVLRATGVDVEDFLDHHVRRAEALDYDQLHAIGLQLEASHSSERPKAHLGMSHKVTDGRIVVDRASTGGPAHAAGLYSGDELVAFDGRKLAAGALTKFLAMQDPGDTVTFHAFRRGRLIERDVTLGEAPADIWSFVPREDITQAQRELLKDWIGDDFRAHS